MYCGSRRKSSYCLCGCVAAVVCQLQHQRSVRTAVEQQARLAAASCVSTLTSGLACVQAFSDELERSCCKCLVSKRALRRKQAKWVRGDTRRARAAGRCQPSTCTVQRHAPWPPVSCCVTTKALQACFSF